jgi:hypothetical protein
MPSELIHYIIHAIYGIILAYIGYAKYIKKADDDKVCNVEFQQLKTDVAILQNNEHANACNREHVQHTTDIAILKAQVFYNQKDVDDIKETLKELRDKL